MKKRLVLLVLPVLLSLGLAAPGQAGTPVASPTLLDFGTYPQSAPPSGLLSATITFSSGDPDRYVAGLKMSSGGGYFFPSSDCPEAENLTEPCHLFVRANSEVPGTGPVQGVAELQLAEHDLGPVVESVAVAVQANITSGSTTAPPPATPAPGHIKQKPKCKKVRGKKVCGKKKGKGKHKGKARGHR